MNMFSATVVIIRVNKENVLGLQIRVCKPLLMKNWPSQKHKDV